MTLDGSKGAEICTNSALHSNKGKGVKLSKSEKNLHLFQHNRCNFYFLLKSCKNTSSDNNCSMMGEEKQEACFLDGRGMSKCVQVIIESGMLLLIDSSSMSRCAGGKVPRRGESWQQGCQNQIPHRAFMLQHRSAASREGHGAGDTRTWLLQN